MAYTSSTLLPFHKQFPDKFRSQTVFGQYEKIYRRPPTLKTNSKQYLKLQSEEKIKISKVVDFSNITHNIKQHQHNIKVVSSKNDFKMYGYCTIAGLYFIPHYLSTQQQFKWIKQSIQEFSNAPYNNLTNLYKQQNNTNKTPTWNDAIKQNDYTDFRRLTWSNIGIQYDWNERRYNLENITAPIPQSMLRLCDDCNDLLTNINGESHGIKVIDDEQKDENGLTFCMKVHPQTSIINFFEVNTKRPMGGHRDAAELINAPLISVSLGNNAIFLISNDDNCEPLALWIKSGDVLIMTGKARFALHCVARVVSETFPHELNVYFDEQIKSAQSVSDRKELELMRKYMIQSRINFNIRQVVDVDKLLCNDNDIVDNCNHLTTCTDFHEIHSF